jgi:hypothetical protein
MSIPIDNAFTAIMSRAVEEYLKVTPAFGLAGEVLDVALLAAHDQAEDGLASCLMVLALARRRGGIPTCARALRHALAELRIDVPLPADDPDGAPRPQDAPSATPDTRSEFARLRDFRNAWKNFMTTGPGVDGQPC